MTDVRTRLSAKLRTVNQDQLAALFRTFGQGIAMTTGYTWAGDDKFISGLSFVVFGLLTLWGMWARSDANLIASAAGVPVVAKIETTPAVAQATPSPKVVPPGVMSVLALVLLLPLLGACVQTTSSTGVASVPARVAPVVTTAEGVTIPLRQTAADRAVARVSPEVARYCTYLRLALSAGEFFADQPRHVTIVRQVKVAVNTYCNRPPVDVATAIDTLERIWINVQSMNAEYAMARRK